MTKAGKSESVRKKNLGQYFTDRKVGRLLAALANASAAKSIIDPMVGSANLLQACLSVGAAPDRLVGVELDPVALDEAHRTLQGQSDVELILGDAFDVPLPTSQFDLVITNPPYIRYQSKADVDGISVPTSAGVRSGLIRAINGRVELSQEERESLLRAAMAYPGTSDIAVPAWILSAALVKNEGVLAIIVPQAWMSRNYAQSVRNLLDDLFAVEFIVEDGDVSWFPDAQVRTQLVVARKTGLSSSREYQPTVVARASRDLEVNNKLCGDLNSEREVARALRGVVSHRPVRLTSGLLARLERGTAFLSSRQSPQIPARVATSLGVEADDIPVRTLESYGWRAGQGLRTGANDFFYVEVFNGTVSPDPRWGISSLALPAECLVPAVRRQNELEIGYAVDPEQLSSRVVYLKGWVTESDLERMGSPDARVLPAAVGKWISQVAKTPLSMKAPTKLFPDLSAVATNCKTGPDGRPFKFWYQLPDFAPRHRPTLFLARVCGGRPKVFLNTSGVVVDANFSGLWPVTSNALPPEAMLALLNSSWTWANLESTCTVLGGGALKVEATDLRRLVLPELSASAIHRLVELGNKLKEDPSDSVRDSIDEVIAGCLTETLPLVGHSSCLRTLAELSRRQRSQSAGSF